MYCIHCGTKLPDGAKFCMNCGAKVAAPEEAPRPHVPPVTHSAPQAQPRQQTRQPAAGWGEGKGSGLAAVPGVGAAFLADGSDVGSGNLYLWEERTGRARKLTSYRDHYPASLGYFDGGLYFIWEFDDERVTLELVRVDAATGARDTVLKLKNTVLFFRAGTTCVWFVGGMCWLCASGKNGPCVVGIDLAARTWTEVPMPKIEGMTPPEDWVKENPDWFSDGVIHSESFDGLTVRGEYGYLAVGGAVYYNVQFPLRDPAQVRLLPNDICCADGGYGMLSVMGGNIVGIGPFRGGMYATPVEGGPVRTVLSRQVMGGSASAAPGSLDASSLARYWWRLDRQYVVANVMVDFAEKKAYRLRCSIQAVDFAPDGRGGVYVLGQVTDKPDPYSVYRDGGLYRLPAGAARALRSAEDAQQYRIWEAE